MSAVYEIRFDVIKLLISLYHFFCLPYMIFTYDNITRYNHQPTSIIIFHFLPLTHSSFYSLIHSLNHTHPLTQSLNHSSFHSQSLINSFIHSLTYSLTLSLTPMHLQEGNGAVSITLNVTSQG